MLCFKGYIICYTMVLVNSDSDWMLGGGYFRITLQQSLGR